MVSDTHSRLVHCLSPCLSLCLSLSGCTGSEDQKVYLWNLQTKEIAQTLVGHTGAVLAVSAHSTEMIVASGGMAPDNTVKIWKDLSLVEGGGSSAAGSSESAPAATEESDSAAAAPAAAQ